MSFIQRFAVAIFILLVILSWLIPGTALVLICSTIASSFAGWDKFWLLCQLNLVFLSGGISYAFIDLFLDIGEQVELISTPDGNITRLLKTSVLLVPSSCAIAAVALGSPVISLIGVHILGCIGCGVAAKLFWD